MKLKIFILISSIFISIYSSQYKPNQNTLTIYDPLMEPRNSRKFSLYNMRDSRNSPTTTAITVIGIATEPTDSHFPETSYTRRDHSSLSLNDQDPIEQYFDSKKEIRCCLLACILKCLGFD